MQAFKKEKRVPLLQNMKVLEVLETVFGTEIMILGDQFLMAAWQAFALDYDIF